MGPHDHKKSFIDELKGFGVFLLVFVGGPIFAGLLFALCALLYKFILSLFI